MGSLGPVHHWLDVAITLINHVNEYEYVQLIATLESASNKRFNCYDCKRRHINNPKGEELSKKERAIKGCFNASKITKYDIENIKFFKCVGNYCDQSVKDYLDLFISYEKGAMPYSGGAAEQPYKIIEIFGLIDEIRRKKQEAKNKPDQDKRIEAKLSRKRNG